MWRDWIRTVEVEPSLYAADFAILGEQVDTLLRTGARIFHFDVGDGHFVPPVTVGPIVLQSIAPIVHQAGGDSVTFHIEAVADVPATIAAAHARGLQVGVAFSPETAPEDVGAVAREADLVLCMSINPGYSGQSFMPEAIERVRSVRALLPDRVHVQVDGGVGPDNVGELYAAGATLLVAGTAIFGREDLPRAYRRLVHLLADA